MPDTLKSMATQDGLRRSVLDDLPDTVEAILGVASLTVGELSRAETGDVFTLDTLLGDPVELRLNGVTIGRGELVSVDDRFAVRIRELGDR